MAFIHNHVPLQGKNKRGINFKILKCSGTLKKLQGLIDVLFRLELVIVNELNHSILVKNISLSTRQCTKQVSWNSPIFPDLITLIA